MNDTNLKYAPDDPKRAGQGRVVDYGKDIADLRAVVVALQQQVAMLQKRLEDSGALYGGTIAGFQQPVNVTYAVGKVFNIETGEYI